MRREGRVGFRRWTSTTAAFIVMCVVLAACGGDEEEPNQPTGDGLTWESHEALVEAANAEGGTLKAFVSFEEETMELVQQTFNEKYPDIDLELTEQSGSDTPRILLEIQGGASDADVVHISQEVYGSYLPLLEQVDLLALAEDGVVDIPADMINPDQPETMAAGSAMAGFSYNPSQLDPSLVPETWEDFLEPDLKGKKFLVDIEPVNLATLVPAWGEEKVLEFAAKIGDQDPIWARGESNAITLMGAGEYQLHFASNYHSAYRASLEAPDTISVGLLDPIPVRLGQVQGIRAGADNVAGAVLFIEHLASADVQTALDELEPQQSSIYAEGSDLAAAVEGKNVSLWDWQYFPLMPAYLEGILEEWGFPSAEVVEED
ncbi:MAG TPA: extracellular solute-binding protein [Actinomycetota bacterium]|nr:extracellular solute-binding protein [Actinomycetota bacterium]